MDSDGIQYLGELSSSGFEDQYLKIRTTENRILSDDVVKTLPYLVNHSLEKEWKLRVESCERFLAYLKTTQPKRILEIGTGNGWFAHQMSLALPQTAIVAQDINEQELEQGNRLFGGDKLTFLYCADLSLLPRQSYDLIVFNASIQYFESIQEILAIIRPSLLPNAEVHVVDSPLYKNEQEARLAKQRSVDYYKKMECVDLAAFYHHHFKENVPVKQYHYQPSKWQKIKGNKNPFPWYQLNWE